MQFCALMATEVKTPRENTSTVEVADIFRRFGKAYLSKEKLTSRQYKAMGAMMACRTPASGHHVDSCDNCGHTQYDYNSCRDRHCPKCQGISRKKWVAARLRDILPVPYYHVVFTLPHLLNELISYNKKFFYELILSKSSETLLTFGRDPKWLGGEIGFYGILHTWGQLLWPHVHVHFIVAGGALSDEGKWIEPASKDKFLFPEAALSQVFRGKFIEALKAAYFDGQLTIPPNLVSIMDDEDRFEAWVNRLVSTDWVVYCKPPFGGAEEVVSYIGRYTHKVAISNNRILDMDDANVRFLYRNYKRSRSEWRQATLSADNFIRRFLWHILPKGFHKIRHYGFLANGRCGAMVSRIREILCDTSMIVCSLVEQVIRCPRCLIGRLSTIKVIDRYGNLIHSQFLAENLNMAYDSL